MPEQLWKTLQQTLQAHSPLALAFSGGLDSRLVAYAAQKAGCDVLLLHVTGAHIPLAETRFAIKWSQEHKLPLRTQVVDVSALNGTQDNGLERCYHCKKHMLSLFAPIAEGQGRILCDGTNADDLHSHRPGLRALKEYAVFSPLAACGIVKNMVRSLASYGELEQPTQKASPCLLTRLHYGMQVDIQILERLDAAEEQLRNLGLQEFRLRLCPEVVLQTTAHDCDVQAIHAVLAQYGFFEARIVEEQSISGFFDRSMGA